MAKKIITVEAVEVVLGSSESEFLAGIFVCGCSAKLVIERGPNGYPLYDIMGTYKALSTWDCTYYDGQLKDAYGLGQEAA